MEELRQEFLSEAISNLETLQKTWHNPADNAALSDAFLNELFRRLHTIKGTAQTFDFPSSGQLAHEIENLLQALREKKIVQTETAFSLLKEGIGVLLENLHNEPVQQLSNSHQEFSAKIRSLIPDAENIAFETFYVEIPPHILTPLSVRELDILTAAMKAGKDFFIIDVGFDFADFEQKFKDFRKFLSIYGEIIATAPNPNVDFSRQIGFRIFFVGKIRHSEIIKIIEPFKASLSFESKTTFGNFDLPDVLHQIVANGEQTAASLGKKVNFQITQDNITLSPKNIKTIYEILLHLTRNAVDHAIELPEERLTAQKDASGNIQICISNTKNKIVVRIKDDGRGINTAKIIEKAKQKELIPAEKTLTEKEALAILFLPGFSTSQTVSTISGRGVGLNVVKEIVDQMSGTIDIKTAVGHGTIFEIHLPF